jgi:hypothetical protein
LDEALLDDAAAATASIGSFVSFVPLLVLALLFAHLRFLLLLP